MSNAISTPPAGGSPRSTVALLHFTSPQHPTGLLYTNADNFQIYLKRDKPYPLIGTTVGEYLNLSSGMIRGMQRG